MVVKLFYFVPDVTVVKPQTLSTTVRGTLKRCRDLEGCEGGRTESFLCTLPICVRPHPVSFLSRLVCRQPSAEQDPDQILR